MKSPCQSFSLPMRCSLFLGFESVAWSLRRLHCPVKKNDLVLEVGSGGNPYFRSNVLIDAYEDTRERHWVKLVSDRPTVLGFGERLPFKDKAFDFVIASHVLEHSPDPAMFLQELQRVAKAGYIETPDAFMERINPYRDHRLEVTDSHGRLTIKKKGGWKPYPDVVNLYEAKVKKILTKETMREHPFNFHVRYYWKDKIEYEILNPEVPADWSPPADKQGRGSNRAFQFTWKQIVLKWVRSVLSQRKRNDQINLVDLLACPSCQAEELVWKEGKLICTACGQAYAVQQNIPVMKPE